MQNLWRAPIGAILLLLAATRVVIAQEGTLIVQVSYLGGKAIDGIRIGVIGAGSLEQTKEGGVATIRLASEIKGGHEVKIQVIVDAQEKNPWVFISPWDQRIIVPSFGAGQIVSVVLARKSDKEALLESGEGRQAILKSILTAIGKLEKSSITSEKLAAILKDQSAAFGLRPEEVDTSIRAAAQKTPDLYEQGLAALYQQSFSLASKRLEQALAISRGELQKARKKVGDQAFFLGEALLEEGRYYEAVASFREALEERGENAETLNGLGEALFYSGDFSAAKTIIDRALAATHGDSSEEELKLGLQSTLAATLSALGDIAGARELEEQVLHNQQMRLGAEHPDTLATMANLAVTLAAEGDLTRAQVLQKQVLNCHKRRLGAEHPTTLTAMANLAPMLFSAGDVAGARKIQEQVFEIRRRRLGAEHPDTLTAKANLALTLAAQGDLVSARVLLEQALEAQERRLGAEHPDTLITMTDLALVWSKQGDADGARNILEQVMESRRRRLGPKHSSTTIAEWNVLRARSALGDKTGAKELENSLAWLLVADDAGLSLDQRAIRGELKNLLGH